MTERKSKAVLVEENRQLRTRVEELEAILHAIRSGEVDALVVSKPAGEQVLPLQGALEPYRIMVEAMGEGAVSLSADSAILYCNARFAELVRMPHDQIIGLPLHGMIAEPDWKRLEEMIARGLKQSMRGELTLLASDGMQIPVQLSMSPLPESDGKAVSVVVTDLTAVAAAAQTRTLLALIVESSDDAIVSITLDGVINSWNRAAEELYGYTADEAIGRTIDSLIVPPERSNELIQELEAIGRGKSTLLEETVRLHKDGTSIDTSIKASPILDAAGKVIGASIDSRDITQQKRVKKERDRATYLLGERLKEVNCLHAISTIIAESELSVEQRLQRVVETIPTGFEFPEVTCARITVADIQYSSADFKETAWRLACDIEKEEGNGSLEVFYTAERPAGDEGPFLREEKDLVNTLGRILGDFLRLEHSLSQLIRFRGLVDASSDEVFVIDPGSARIVDVNRQACTALGYSRDELLRLRVIDISTMMPNASAWDGHVKKLKKAGSILLEGDARRKDGSTFPAEISVRHVSQDKGDYIIAIARDITERKRVEKALQASEEEFRTLAESMPQIVWITQPDGRNIYFNQQWMDYTGMTLEESLGNGWNKPFHPDDQQAAWVAWQRATAEVDIYSIESRLRRADGIYRWWLVRGVPLKDATGKILKWFGTCTDIHDLKTAELNIALANRDLIESERRFTNLLDNVELISVMRDREERITYCNEHFLNLIGWRREDLIGNNWAELLVPPEIVEQKKKLFANLLLDKPAARHYESEILTRSGERRLIRWNNTLLHSGAGDVIGTASIGEDITERKRAENRVAQLNRILAVLSGINTLIVRVNDREELFSEACNIAVSAGGFRMAMLVIVDPTTMLPASITSAGKDEKLMAEIEKIMSSSAGMQKTLVAQVIREKKAVIANDAQNDPRLLFGQQYSAAGVRSMTVMPLIISAEAVGVFALYASEIEFFHDYEMNMLAELADDIAYAIDHIDKQEQLNYLAYYDELTGLANRTLLLKWVAQYMRGEASSKRKLALGLIDLERFRNINDSLGRVAGDDLLKQVAKWLTQFTQDDDLLARIDADHFAFLIPDIETDENLARYVEKLMTAFQEHSFDLNDVMFRLSIKIGIAVFPDDGDNVDILYTNAEAALKRAKQSGDRYLVYNQKMTDSVADKLRLENQLRGAVDNKEFVLYYQPKVNLMSGEVTSAEALIRWNDPLTGLVPPGMFIPTLEETGLISEVGRWVLRQAVTDWLRWRNAGLPAVRIAVNVSPLQLRNANFLDELKEILAIDAEVAGGLELEITESMIMQDIERNIATLKAARALGISIAIDDFGTGFSSLAYLSKLPVDKLKIDRSFVIDMTTGPESLAMVSTVVSLAHSLKLKVVAEGVETEEQSRLLRLLDCDEMQGFLFSKPVPVEIFEAEFLAPITPGEKR